MFNKNSKWSQVVYKNQGFVPDNPQDRGTHDNQQERVQLSPIVLEDEVKGKNEIFDKYFLHSGSNFGENSSTTEDFSSEYDESRAQSSTADDHDEFDVIRPSGTRHGDKTKYDGDGKKSTSIMTSEAKHKHRDVNKRTVDNDFHNISNGDDETKHKQAKHRGHRKTTGATDASKAAVTGVERDSSGNKTHNSQPNQHSVLRSAVYYQNRFIVQDPYEGRKSSESCHHSRGGSPRDRASNSSRVDDNNLNTRSRKNDRQSMDLERKTGNRRNIEMDASSVTMDARGIEIILTDPENSSKQIAANEKEKNNTVWKKITRFLQDNRMKGNPDSDRILNSDHPEEYRVLKKVLNLIFLTIGILLFVAVIVVVIYAFVVGNPPPADITRRSNSSDT